MNKIILSIVLTSILVAVMVVPVKADDVQDVTASVSVAEIISITLTDPDPAGIQFSNVIPPVTEQGADGQGEYTPAISVNVADETNVNVDIYIKGTKSITENLDLINWKYSKNYSKTDIQGLTDTYQTYYTDLSAPVLVPFYHWVNVPEGTSSGSHTVTVSYKAVKHVIP
jgi:hypothetical protein